MVTLIFLWGVSEYILINILTYDPGGEQIKEEAFQDGDFLQKVHQYLSSPDVLENIIAFQRENQCQSRIIKKKKKMAAIFLEKAGFFNLLHKVTLKRVSTKCITIARPFPVKYR